MAPPFLKRLRRDRLSELVAGLATTGFSLYAVFAIATSQTSVEGPTTVSALKTLMYVTIGDMIGFVLVFLTSLYTSSVGDLGTEEDNARKHAWEGFADYLFIISAFISSVAIGGVFPKISLIDVYQTAQRETLLDQNITITWFVGAWAVVWGIMRALNATIRRGAPAPVHDSGKLGQQQPSTTDGATPGQQVTKQLSAVRLGFF